MSQATRFGTAYIARALPRGGSLASLRNSTRIASRSSLFSSIRSPIQTRSPIELMPRNLAREFHSSRISRSPSETATETTASAALSAAETTTSSATEAVASAASVVDPSIAVQTTMQVGDLASYGLTTAFPTRITEYALEFIHVTTGLPWWATIAVAVIGIRTVMLPLAIYAQKNVALLNKHKPDMTLLMNEQRRAAESGDVLAAARAAREVSAFNKRHGIHPLRGGAAGIATAPMMMMLFFALKDLAVVPVSGMAASSMLWVADLSQPDPTYILPVLSCVGMMGVIELQSKLNSAVEQSKQMKIGMRVAGVAMAYFTCGLPADIFVFWVTNNLYSLGQIIVLNKKSVKRRLGIVDVEKVKFAREQSQSQLPKLDIKELFGKKKSSRFVVKNKDLK